MPSTEDKRPTIKELEAAINAGMCVDLHPDGSMTAAPPTVDELKQKLLVAEERINLLRAELVKAVNKLTAIERLINS